MKRELAFVGLALLLGSCSKTEKKPNVLFIISDDLTATAVSSYENKACQTPNIDQLASEGVRFTKAYSQYPVCGPSRASLMFGYYPSATGTYGYVSGRENVGPDRKSWAQLFRDNGYYTARVSKIYHMGVPIDIEKGSDGEDDPASWTEKFNSQGPEWKAPGEGELVQGNPDGTLPIKGGNVMTIVKADGDDLVHSDGRTAEKACQLIREHKNDPFFLAVGFVRPHVPFVAPANYFEPYPHEEVNLPRKVEGDWDDIPKRGINYVTSVNGQMNETQEKKAVAAYYASVSYMDAQVGKVLKTLEEEGLEDNTIVVFTSDHGFHLGEHSFWMKVSLHEESVRVPMIIKVPGKKPAVCHSFAELVDLYPTIAELAGLEYSEHLQGKSLAKTLDNPEHAVRDMAFSVTQGGKSFLLRTDKWAYVQYDEDAGSGIELFDMEKDPQQFTNLAENPAYATVVDDFKEKLKHKLQEVRANDLNL
ncbi:sulfatase [Sunxiuqinia elliptica]|uniref:Choline-sulfatase n=1 Tax=Sunxiuqinia elliptica TaxID=655355 RepID=A0A4R6GX91_9BACT|nr:sulfatase [Sunxiuqinia elliptica]TDO00024.1 choline-sulfatase [Sunxiuqinia elliptica]TDO57215.1 choline-sulfatase [Sunxiuqinia elliptica]